MGSWSVNENRVPVWTGDDGREHLLFVASLAFDLGGRFEAVAARDALADLIEARESPVPDEPNMVMYEMDYEEGCLVPVPDEPAACGVIELGPRGAQTEDGLGHPTWADGAPMLIGDRVWVDEIEGEDEHGRSEVVKNATGHVFSITPEIVTIVGLWADDDEGWEAAPKELRRRPAPSHPTGEERDDG